MRRALFIASVLASCAVACGDTSRWSTSQSASAGGMATSGAAGLGSTSPGEGGAPSVPGTGSGGTSESGGAPVLSGTSGAGLGGAPMGGSAPVPAAGGSFSTGGTTTGGSSGAGDGGTPPAPANLSHGFDTVAVEPGQELLDTCQSWTLDNPEPVYVNKVVETNGGAFHHSNWIWVPDSLYAGADGTWNCKDRGFDQIAAGAFGGVFFAQSTQARADTQEFPPHVAFMMPAHARIIGDVHLFNTGIAKVDTSLRFELYTLPAAEVRVPLQPMAFTNLTLDIAPQMETRARMQCAVPQPDFNVYYVLPHFHGLGQGLSIDVAGGSMDGMNIFKSAGAIGNSLGKMFDPPIAVSGATGLAVTCDYQNPRSSTVKYGEGDQEMCVVLLYTDGKKTGGETFGNISKSDTGMIHSTDDLCLAVGI